MTPGSRAHLLVVDDSEGFCEMAETWLSPKYDVEIVHDGVAALACAEARTPDLILLDVMMPRMSGVDLFKALRQRPALRRVPVLFLTAWHQLLSGQDADLFANCRVLLKPFRIDELQEQIEQMLGRPA